MPVLQWNNPVFESAARPWGHAGKSGGADRDRTDDLLLAKQTLSRLSYSPEVRPRVVGLGRFELPTSPLSGVRSNQLSYRPAHDARLDAGPPETGAHKWRAVVKEQSPRRTHTPEDWQL